MASGSVVFRPHPLRGPTCAFTQKVRQHPVNAQLQGRRTYDRRKCDFRYNSVMK